MRVEVDERSESMSDTHTQTHMGRTVRGSRILTSSRRLLQRRGTRRLMTSAFGLFCGLFFSQNKSINDCALPEKLVKISPSISQKAISLLHAASSCFLC